MAMYVRRTFANVAASQTDSVLVAAVPGTAIKVLGVVAQAGGTATTIVFNTKPTGAGTAISATFQNGTNGSVVLPETENGDGWFETNVGEGLTCTTGAGSTTAVQIIYTTRAV
jgi:hypothetical protein